MGARTVRHTASKLLLGVVLSVGTAQADTITPDIFSNDALAVGDSVTIRKTVVVEAGSPSTSLIDIMFLFDTTGSMGPAIGSAKAASTTLLAGLASFGNLASGTGFFGDPNFNGVVSDLSTNAATTVASIATFQAGVPDNGGDFPEQGNAGVNDAANRTSWRTGSNRFLVALGDASFKDNPNDPAVLASLAANNVNLIGLNFGGASFATSIAELGGSTFAGGTTEADLVAAITSGIISGFASYGTVGVGDLGAGLPSIGVSSVCVSADAGLCNGSLAEGTFNRSVDRTFAFDVTFKRLAAGSVVFDTSALVDGGIVASERDSFADGTVPPVPLPAAAWLLLSGFGALAAAKRRKRA